MSPALPVTRFAPSPTGRLHLGNARTALFNWLLARRDGGRFLVRMEDTDAARSTPALAAGVLEDLRWLGLDWDAGPDREDDRGPYAQSARAAVYDDHLARLQSTGEAYECFCTPAELEVSRRVQLAAGRPPRYAGTCRHLTDAQRAAHRAAGRQPALRFRVAPGAEVAFDDLVRGPQRAAAADVGDFIVRRADGSAAFFFANALDDALMGVTHVLRGEDHLTNTHRQLLVLAAFGLPAPQYGHLSLLLGPGGAPLSKREGATSLADLRAAGVLPEALRNLLARLGHSYADQAWHDDAALAAGFDTTHLGRAPAQFDDAQLRHWQHEAVQRAAPEILLGWVAGALPPGLEAAAALRFVSTTRGNFNSPEGAREWAHRVYGSLPCAPAETVAACRAAGPAYFAALAAAFDAHGADLKALAAAVLAATGAKGRAFFLPLRLALTHTHDGPELAPLLALLPPAVVRERLGAAALLSTAAA